MNKTAFNVGDYPQSGSRCRTEAPQAEEIVFDCRRLALVYTRPLCVWESGMV